MWRSLASNMMTILVVLLFMLAGVVIWGQTQYRAEGPLEEAICVRVERGATMTRISRKLLADGAISSGQIFRIGADYTDKSRQLKAGSYLVRPGATMEDIVDALTRGGASTCGTEIVYRIGVTRALTEVRELDPATNSFAERAKFNPAEDEIPEIYKQKRAEGDTRYRIALAEGVTSWQVVEALKGIDILSGTIEGLPDEGTLAPDSYEISKGAERADLIADMQALQLLRLKAAWEGRDENVPVSTQEELLILASIIEKETGIPSERGLVASVFANRLELGMRLQTDPTVIYGVTEGRGVLGRGLRQSELRKVTPWNTYVIPGLPPTPIANPGEASMEAAANPLASDYVFFVADGSGGHAFAATLEEHNRNVAKWREIEAQRGSD